MVYFLLFSVLSLAFKFYIARRVYIKKPYMLTVVDLIFIAIPFAGLIIALTLITFAFDEVDQENLIRKILFIKKH